MCPTRRRVRQPKALEPTISLEEHSTMASPALHFRLFACCRPVRGARRSVICDLQRGTFVFIPNGLYDILTEHQTQTVDAIKALYEHRYDDVIDEYFAFLIEHEYGFWCDEPERLFE